jgi:transcriptional regulator with XRE-family HTH domain
MKTIKENPASYVVRSEFGKALATLRLQLGVSQKTLALILQEEGYGYKATTISSIERGERNPSPEFIHALEEVFNLEETDITRLLEARDTDDRTQFRIRYRSTKKSRKNT